MTMLRVAAAALALLLAGCLDATQDGRAPGDDDASFTRVDAAPLAFHKWSTCGLCHGGQFEDPEQRLFIAFEDGRAILLHYNPSGGARGVQVAPNVTFDRAQLVELVEGIGISTLEPSFDTVWIGRVDRATLSEDALKDLRAAIVEDWAQPTVGASDCADCAGFGTYGLYDNATWPSMTVNAIGDSGTPANAHFLRLDHAFRAAEAELDASRAPAGEMPPQPSPTTPRPWEMTRPARAECMEWSVTVSPPTVAAGQGANVTASLRNVCDEPIQVQGNGGCAMEGLAAAIVVDGRSYQLVDRGAASHTLICTLILPGPVTIEPGATHSKMWRWNGTLGQREPGSCCERHELLAPGDYDVRAWATSPEGLPEGAARISVHGPPSA